jgi:hypothetical protein
MNDDPVQARMLRFKSGLREGGSSPQYEVLATYWTRGEDALFAFCRDGLLLDPEGAPRFIPFVEIADAGYYNRAMVERAKRMKLGGSPEPLSVTLSSGEVIDLPLDIRDDGMPELLGIAKLIDQRSRIFKAEQRREDATGQP